MNNLYAGFLQVAQSAVPYFGQWTYRQPMLIKPETNDTMRFLQKALHKAIHHLAENYDIYRRLMPVSDSVAAILARCKDVPYRAGTYRTDFLIDENRQIKLIEITCRFALNGFFTSGFLNLLADQYLKDKPGLRKIDQYTPFFSHLMNYFGDFARVCILTGRDKRNDTKYICPIFEKAGYPVHIIEANDIPQRLTLLENAAVIGELDHDELCQLPPDAIDAIIHSNLLNDLRTVFLVHDKRFFSLLGNDAFLNAALNREESARFRDYLVPTWAWQERQDLWEQARAHKDGWIIKPRALGKGIGVRAGCVTNEAEWQALFLQDAVADLTLQPYIAQSKFHGLVGDEIRDDYIVGTLLFFEDEFFGPGLFRASSHPITNQGDDRKVAPLVIEDTHLSVEEMIL